MFVVITSDAYNYAPWFSTIKIRGRLAYGYLACVSKKLICGQQFIATTRHVNVRSLKTRIYNRMVIVCDSAHCTDHRLVVMRSVYSAKGRDLLIKTHDAVLYMIHIQCICMSPYSSFTTEVLINVKLATKDTQAKIESIAIVYDDIVINTMQWTGGRKQFFDIWK